jgi:nucleoside-diphosphate-sugar epimerase/phytoene/squalene synthetase
MSTAYLHFAGSQPRPASPLPTPEEDATFCATMLPKVSRTFALSIAALPEELRDAVRVAYLLCRIVDTIEDDARIAGDDRERLYDVFDALMSDDRSEPAELEQETERLELGRNAEGVLGDDHTLCLGAGSVFRAYRALSQNQRAAIRPHVLEMSRGMREFTRRADATGRLRLRDLDELERYCYFVAGTVGKLLTGLFELVVPDMPPSLLTQIRARAVSFGLALQLVNIVKDVAEDLPRGDCFLPVNLAEEHGIRLDHILDPAHREQGLAIIRAVTARAREHLRRAEQYTLLWPVEGGADVRLFCTVPLVLALATLHEVEEGDDTLVEGKTPKITREAVMQIFSDAGVAVKRNDTLRWMIGYYASGEYLAAQSMPAPALASVCPKEKSGRPSTMPPAPEAPKASAGSKSDAPPASTTMDSRTRGSGNDDRTAVRRFTGKVLVTGAAGHLGANLVHRLLKDGRDVRVLLRQGSNNEAMDGLAVERVYGDLRDEAAVIEAVRGCETVFHTAAMVSTLQGNAKHKREIFGCNVLGTKNLLSACKLTGVKRVVVTGSFSATGYDLDDSSRPATEDTPFFPFSTHLPYARTKSLAEHECLKAVADGLDVVMVTSCAILGPHDHKPSRMGQTLIDHANGKLRAYIPGGFEFVAARDIVDGHIRGMERGRTGQKYTIATQFMTLDDILEIFEEVSGVPRPKLKLPPLVMQGLAHVSSFVLTNFFPNAPQRFTPDAVRILRLQRRANTDKARRELGFVPSSLRDALFDAYDDFARRGLVPRHMRIVDAPAVRDEVAHAAAE